MSILFSMVRSYLKIRPFNDSYDGPATAVWNQMIRRFQELHKVPAWILQERNKSWAIWECWSTYMLREHVSHQ